MAKSIVPIISVIMPVYNTEKYLEKSINSILSQSFKKFEFIIIEDGSTDNSLDIIESYDDNRIKVIKNHKNEGLIHSLNKGITIAQGKYIARMDADDVSHPLRLKIQYDFLETNSEVDLVGTNAEVIDDLDKKSGIIYNMPKTQNEIKIKALFQCPFVHPSIMCKNEIFKAFRYDINYPVAEDYHLWTNIINNFKVANLDQVLLFYRVHKFNESQNKKNSTKKISSLKKIFLKQFKQIGLNLSSKEIKIHLIFCSEVYEIKNKSIDDYKKVYKWIEYLQKQNVLNKYFSEDTFNKVLAKYWFNFCLRNAKYLLFKGFNFYYKSYLSSYNSKSKTILLFILTISYNKYINRIFQLVKNLILPIFKIKI